MQLSDTVLGSRVARTLRDRTSAALLTIGSDVFSRHDLARVDCYSFAAAANLSAILNRALHVKNTADVFHNVAPADLALPRLGAFSIAVLGAAFEAKGLGGDKPLEAWIRHHTDEDDAKIVAFVTLKKRDDGAAAEQKRAKARKASRRDQAHRLRVARFSTRQHRKAG